MRDTRKVGRVMVLLTLLGKSEEKDAAGVVMSTTLRREVGIVTVPRLNLIIQPKADEKTISKCLFQGRIIQLAQLRSNP